MKTIIFLCMLLVSSAALPASGQRKGGGPGSGAANDGTPNPDSLRHYLQLMQKGDTAALSRYQARLGVPRESPRVARMALIARADRDSVVLRWAVSKAGGWEVANRVGYLVERATMDAQGRAIRSSLHRLTLLPLKPWALEEWKRRAPRDDTYAAVAAQALYGKSFTANTVDPGNGQSVRNAISEFSGRFGFAMFAADNDPLAAEGLGVRLVDKDVRVGERYVYRVYLAARDSSYAVDTAYTVVSPAQYTPPPPPPGLTVEGRDGSIILRWMNPPAREGFSGYFIERSDDGGKSYHRLNEHPYAPLTTHAEKIPAQPTYTDTSITNYKVYRYRIWGVDAFAELSAPAEVEGFGRDLTPPPPPILKKPEQLSTHAVRLTWEEPTVVPDLKGFVVTKSAGSLQGFHPLGEKAPPPRAPKTAQKGKGKKQKQETPAPAATQDLLKQLLPGTARSYTDTAATSDEPYYMVASVDTAGNIASSLPVYAEIIDTAAPSPPTGLSGRIDTNGVATLHWKLSPERDIIGYRLYWANEAAHEFSMRNQEMIKDTMFVDTVNLNTLSHRIYYRIASINARHHQSPMSSILALKRPDRIPPATPVFTDVFVTDSAVTLTWAASPSDDVAREFLYRRVASDSRWQQLAAVRPHTGMYVDTAVQKKTLYAYQIVAVDSTGLRSLPSETVQARPYDTGVRPPVKNLAAVLGTKTGTVRLTWQYELPGRQKFWFVIYRSVAGTGLRTYKSIESKQRTFVDDQLVGKGTYGYSVKVMSQGGGESPLPAPVTVNVQ
jgi:uncharacterized protein